MVFIVKTTCCTLYNYTMTQVRWGGVKVMTRGRHGYAFVGKCAVLIPFGGRCSLMTVLKGRKRSTEKVLHKEYKQVSASKVVVRDGEWDHRAPVTGLRARKDLWYLQTSCANALLTTTKQGVKGLDESFRGVGERQQAS